MHAINHTATSAAAAIRACFGDKAAAYTLAADAISTATQRTILHGDAALFRAMQEAAEGRKGAAAKDMVGRILAAESAALAAKAETYPEGRKGKATAEQVASAEAAAAPIAADFLTACNGDATLRSEKGKAAAVKAAETKAAKVADAGKADATKPEGLQGTEGAITLADLLARIRQGDSAAVMMGQAIRGALNEYEAAASEAATIANTKAAAVAKAAEDKAARKAAKELERKAA